MLRSFKSPGVLAFATTPTAANAATYQFTLVFRLAESIDTPAASDTWLATAGQDPREVALPGGAFLPAANGPRPELYPNYTAISFPDRLLDRALPASLSSSTGQSYNEDVPLFELPRGPFLSLGELQHLTLTGDRPFGPGNSWGNGAGANGWFDRYFFSGLAAETAAPSTPPQGLPNSLLRLVGVTERGNIPVAADLTDPALDGYTSKYLLQRGAFNVNSLSKAAWIGVMLGGRGPPGSDFRYLKPFAATGTSGDAAASAAVAGGAIFYRFPQSAQETFAADAGYAASTSVPPVGPNVASAANTHLFRRGLRALSAEQTAALAGNITARLKEKQAESGPIRSLEEFLSPSPGFGGVNLLERAMADTISADGVSLNDPAAIPEFSSQWLTSGDVMGLLAPVLFARSDTFVVRAYGDAFSAGGNRQSRAWCEARVQRFPDYVDPSQPPETAAGSLNPTNQNFGRRFRVVSFRWLAPGDI